MVYQFTCCERIDSPDIPSHHEQVVVIEGLLSPPIEAEGRGEALLKLKDWFKENKCRPYREVT